MIKPANKFYEFTGEVIYCWPLADVGQVRDKSTSVQGRRRHNRKARTGRKRMGQYGYGCVMPVFIAYALPKPLYVAKLSFLWKSFLLKSLPQSSFLSESHSQ